MQAIHPEAIFLSEAFTRPKLMKWLAKAGFTQSYTYFTWRNFKQELTEYFTELTTPPESDYMRGNLFPNTPDILPYFLQESGRAGFNIRAVLAATLSSVYGIYSGFELCEARPSRKGGIPELGKIRLQGVGLGPPGQHSGRHQQNESNPQGSSGAA